MLTRGVVHHQINDDFDTTRMGSRQKRLKILHGAKIRLRGIVVSHIIAMITG